MKSIKENNITTLDQLLNKKYGKNGTAKRQHWEEGFEIFLNETGIIKSQSDIQKKPKKI